MATYMPVPFRAGLARIPSVMPSPPLRASIAVQSLASSLSFTLSSPSRPAHEAALAPALDIRALGIIVVGVHYVCTRRRRRSRIRPDYFKF